jgi:ribosomal protein S18 acetylase RimI-like enzyme
MSEPSVRSELHPGDLGAIVAHHGRMYAAEYGVDSRFEGHVAASVGEVAKRDFPREREAIRIVELGGEHAGSVALTEEADNCAAIRWFAFDAAVRGRGLGRRLLEELLAKARADGYRQVWLETFSDLRAAAHLYRDNGFHVVWEDPAPRWGRETITYQRYELELGAATSPAESDRASAPA